MSSTACYNLYLLSIYTDILSCLHTEDEDVLGPDPSQAATRISENPYLLNKLPYTTAALKESMRLFPAVSSTRSCESPQWLAVPDRANLFSLALLSCLPP